MAAQVIDGTPAEKAVELLREACELCRDILSRETTPAITEPLADAVNELEFAIEALERERRLLP